MWIGDRIPAARSGIRLLESRIISHRARAVRHRTRLDYRPVDSPVRARGQLPDLGFDTLIHSAGTRSRCPLIVYGSRGQLVPHRRCGRGRRPSAARNRPRRISRSLSAVIRASERHASAGSRMRLATRLSFITLKPGSLSWPTLPPKGDTYQTDQGSASPTRGIGDRHGRSRRPRAELSTTINTRLRAIVSMTLSGWKTAPGARPRSLGPCRLVPPVGLEPTTKEL